MKRRFCGSVPKDPNSPDANEDKFAFSKTGGRLALSDGASESFDSKLWADALTRKFVSDPKFGPEWVLRALADYSAAHDFQSMSWAKQAAYERGSFATLLGVEHVRSHDAVELLAIGDTIAVLADGENLVAAWPFEDPDKFQERPTLLATITSHNGFINASDFWTVHGKTFHLKGLKSPKLVCMTDALGEWALKEASAGRTGLAELLSIQSEDQLTELVLRERAARRMRVDDSTLIVLSFGKNKRNGIPLA